MGIAMRVPVSRRLIYSINLIIIEGDKFTRSGDRTHDGLIQYTSGTKYRKKGIHAKPSPGRQRGFKESCEYVSVTFEEILAKYDQRSAARATIAALQVLVLTGVVFSSVGTGLLLGVSDRNEPNGELGARLEPSSLGMRSIHPWTTTRNA